jgi:hypothetical protein
MRASVAVAWVAAVGLLAGTVSAQSQSRPASPRGTAATQVGGKWVSEKPDASPSYVGGKWIEIDYGRPIKRQREQLFGSGADYGKAVNAGAPLWRAGANQTTRLTTEAPLTISGTRLEPGTYNLMIDLAPGRWTLVVSSQAVQTIYDPNEKAALWGSYNYEPGKDVLRAPMQLLTSTVSVDQLTWGFVDVTATGGKIALWWDREFAVVPFEVAR